MVPEDRFRPVRRFRYVIADVFTDVPLEGNQLAVFTDAREIAEDRLQIPHPFLHLRRFVLVPLADIAPEFEHPTLYQSIVDLLGELPGEGDVVPYPD